MATHVDPFTGAPLDADEPATPRGYDPELDEGDQDSILIEREQLPQGFIHQHEPQAGRRFQWAVAVPLILVPHLIAVLVGFFAVYLGARGMLVANGQTLVPVLVVGGSAAALASAAASIYLWPNRVPIGGIRTISYGLLGGALVFAVVVLFLGLVLGRLM